MHVAVAPIAWVSHASGHCIDHPPAQACWTNTFHSVNLSTWLVPTNFNIGEECCHRWAKSSADARRIALFFEDAAGHRDIWTFERLGAATNQFANALTRMGVKPGDRVATILGQSAEAVIAQLGAYSVGAVAMPLATNLAPKALEFRLRDSETRVAIVGTEAASNLLSILSRCSKLTQVIGVGVEDNRLLPWRSLMIRQPEQFKPVTTRSEDPALLLYSSDTSHPARGVLLPHRALIGALPGFVAAQNWFPQNAEVFWTPLDWAHASGLLCGVLPTLILVVPCWACVEPPRLVRHTICSGAITSRMHSRQVP